MSADTCRTATFPVSHGQEQIWFLNELNQRSQLAYTLAMRVSIAGELNTLKLQRAVNQVAASQEILRTSFAYDNEKLRQVISPSATLPVRYVECIDDAPALKRLINMEVQRGWSLGTAPLYRLLLIKTGDQQHELVICTHHIVCDGISLQLLLKKIVTVYTDPTGSPADPNDEALQFVDYATWSRQHTYTGLQYWRKQLADAPTVLDISTLPKRSEQQTFAGARIPVEFSHHQWQALRQRFRSEGISCAAVFLAAYCVVLHRLAEQDDILIGVPTSNRLRPELAQMIGYLSNMCIFRSTYAQDQSVIDYLQQIQLDLTQLIEHGETPFQQVLQSVGHTRQAGMTPLFQVLFGYEQGVQRTLDTGDLKLTVSDVDTGAARLDLSLFLFEDHELNISGFLEYATDSIDTEAAEDMVRMLTSVLRAFVMAPHAALSAVLLGPPDSQGQTPAATANFSSVPARLLALGERQPDAIALRDESGELTYAQLRQQILQAAAALRTLGAEPGKLIAIIGERGNPWVVAMLAIWQVGGVYVPLSRDLPEKRLLGILAELEGVMLITDDSAPDHFGQPVTLSMSALFAEAAAPSEQHATDASPHSGYMMFTSGSTGKPKGVHVSQANLVATLNAFGQLLALKPSDRMLALTTFSFDISLLELLLPLVQGASVQIAAAQSQRDMQKLAGYLADPRITFVQATPVTWRLLLATGWQPQERLTMLCGGEALPQDLADRLCLPGMTLWNLYGPTETTIWSTAFQLKPGDPVQLGNPVPGTRLAVVDRNLHSVPRGVIGELLVCGPSVSRGYYRNPVETAKQFVPDPIAAGRRAYLTGDRVRMQQDGSLVYIGRRDDQVKLRGHRIELGEIEAALRGLPGVRDAAAQVHGQDASRAIQAFVQLCTTADASRIDIGHWLEILRRTLPEAWLPTEYFRIEGIPLTYNGKRDRKRLMHQAVRLQAPSQRVAPGSKTETQVQQIWCDLLNREDIGVTDDFFQVGGHSILVARMVERIEATFGRRVPIADIYFSPTIARVAATLDSMTFEKGLAAHSMKGDWEFTAISLQHNAGSTADAQEK
ncbi:amino acid adenylation domain-containing protein [Pseudomonas orientalis]|uniref:non-ribosomal peptide synthetase n=1 Tax=Pseudomonas orientalis TaxID=76758 RepID=UPI002FE2C763